MKVRKAMQNVEIGVVWGGYYWAIIIHMVLHCMFLCPVKQMTLSWKNTKCVL